MATVPPRQVQHIKQRGNAFYLSIPRPIMKRLGWNLHDVLTIEVIEGSVVLTRVELPKVNVMRTTGQT